MKPSIELVLYVYNEAEHLERAILSAINDVDEVTVWDTGSTDGTLDIAQTYADRLYRLAVPEEAMDFGEIETMVMHLARCDWVFRLDGDEELGRRDPRSCLKSLIMSGSAGAWGLARYRWADMDRVHQVEKEAWPDYQYRLVLNDGRSRFVGPLHPNFETEHRIGRTTDLYLDHYVDPLHLRAGERLEQRNRLYARLAAKAGKAPEGSAEAMKLAGSR
jgi:glycosyltransferase involved in cell wall biosynthesis